MELVTYDDKTKEYTVRFKQDEFLDLMDMASGVCATPGLQDFTALGVTEQRASELSEALVLIVKDTLNK